MYTYIIESQGFIKIGRAGEIEPRIKSYETHNPLFRVLKIVKEDLEQELHSIFEDMRYKNEWFSLNKEALKYLLSEESLKEARLIRQDRQEKWYRENYYYPKKSEIIPGPCVGLSIVEVQFITN